jgi:hypothetical protein
MFFANFDRICLITFGEFFINLSLSNSTLQSILEFYIIHSILPKIPQTFIILDKIEFNKRVDFCHRGSSVELISPLLYID